jgi:hypothetical protein
MDRLGFHCRPHYFNRSFDHRTELKRPDIKSKPARNDSGNIEQIRDQLSLHLSVPLNRLDRSCSLLFIQFAGAHQRSPIGDCAKRASKLVRDYRQKFVLEAVGLFGLLASFLL